MALFKKKPKNKEKEFILWFNELGIEDVPHVGGKNASLGEMYRNLTKKGVNIPNGFAITAHSYHHLLEKAGIRNEVKNILKGLNTKDMRDLADKGHRVRELIKNAEFPEDLKQEIIKAYKKLCKEYGKRTDVAVRSSATAEDLPDASFAGQQETYLNIKGDHDLIAACKKCFASLFTNRAISYRVDKKFDHFSIGLSIGVQKMVRSDLSCSGVMFSIDTETGFKDAVFITGAYGLGENVVQGAVNPDEYYVFKPTLKQGFKPIISKKVGPKKIKMIYASEGNKTVKNIPVNKEDRKKFVLEDKEVLKLAEWACIIEDHYSEKANYFKPMDMEWAKDGKTKKLFIVQARPETVQSQRDLNTLEEYKLQQKGKIVAKGKAVGMKIGQGPANIIKDVKDINNFKKGQILVTDMTDPDWEPIMKIASAIVTNRGGRTCFDGNTKILTNKGFMTMQQVHEEGYNGLLTPSLNRQTKRIEWKPIIASMKKKSKKIKISVSIRGKIRDNTLTITPDHKMINIKNRQLVDTEIKQMLLDKEMVCIAQHIPMINQTTEKDKRLAYLLGGIMTDGHIYRSRTHGEVQFIQKQIPEKERFINHMQDCMTSVYNKSFVPFEKKISTGMIRGKEVRGQATAFRLYSKDIAYNMHEQKNQIVTTLLQSDEEVAYNFLAGVIDGDGTFYNNRINIYISNRNLLEGTMLACLRIGIIPQVTKNRNIHNVQIVEKLDKILKYTKRIKGVIRNRVIKSRFFSTRQIFNKDEVRGQTKLRYDKNLYISEEDLKKENSQKIRELLESDLRMNRMVDLKEESFGDVYNITVADNHNYAVFTEKLTPVLVNNCHAAIISRELGVPCIVGTENGTQLIKQGQKITTDCSSGEIGYIYDKLLKFKIHKTNLKSIPETRTEIMMNIGNPEEAFEFSFLPNSGVGLAREEFIINSYIKVHPRALLEFNKVTDNKIRNQINKLTEGYKNKAQFFVDKLAQGVGTLAAAFYPKKVIIRLSDFKSNEYANLIGGKYFEPTEDNPMIGWRGASRYYSPAYKDAFALECMAMRKVMKEFGLKNIVLMIPFCRTVEEGLLVLKEMKKNGLEKGKDNLKIILMCEIPSNVILAEEFLEHFDGFSIGSNDLTQLTLGVDRDSELVAHVYEERNQAVKTLIRRVIHIANKMNKYIGICGQAPSDYPEFAEFLVEAGIHSMSLNPDSVVKTTLTVAKTEKKLGIKPKKK